MQPHLNKAGILNFYISLWAMLFTKCFCNKKSLLYNRPNMLTMT